ncbi:TIGR00296 family protein [Methanoculleus sp. YWC-01]|uniref:Protein HL657_08380 n=1 Tax=Methanoculleus nereidis TaxID=2735141 RepID=A0ABU3Z2Y7_9EURY|nr:TIGR00296 family protein [Methanoculleus sp. YWC-01]MDV4343182.1 TIGR00296 family protein [Methanoculleus sp. YWC-01]
MEMLTPEEGRTAVRLARNAIEKAVDGKRTELPVRSPIFGEKRGVFVTLKRQGRLRGCIGLPYPIKPLGDAILEAAVSAALEDPRFPPVSRSELADLDLEVTVLTPPRPLDCPPEERPGCVDVGKHGLIVSGLGTGGLLLPQVPTEYGWSSREFLDQTCVKAGLPPGCWKRADVAVQTFEGQIFEEKAV